MDCKNCLLKYIKYITFCDSYKFTNAKASASLVDIDTCSALAAGMEADSVHTCDHCDNGPKHIPPDQWYHQPMLKVCKGVFYFSLLLWRKHFFFKLQACQKKNKSLISSCLTPRKILNTKPKNIKHNIVTSSDYHP